MSQNIFTFYLYYVSSAGFFFRLSKNPLHSNFDSRFNSKNKQLYTLPKRLSKLTVPLKIRSIDLSLLFLYSSPYSLFVFSPFFTSVLLFFFSPFLFLLKTYKLLLNNSCSIRYACDPFLLSLLSVTETLSKPS